MKPIAGFAAMLLAAVLSACSEDPGPGPGPESGNVEEMAIELEGYCGEFVAANRPTETFRITAEADLPVGFQPDSGDYLVLKVFGYMANMADVPACPYHASKISVQSADVTEAGTVVFTVSANLDGRLGNYFGLEGFSAKQEEREYGTFRVNRPPIAFDPKRSKYRFEGLAVADANIRVRNATGLPIDSVQVGDQAYGAIGIGQTSGYRPFGEVYRYNYIRFNSGSTKLILMPIDYVGETPIGNGFFTYELYLSGPQHLDIRFSRD